MSDSCLDWLDEYIASIPSISAGKRSIFDIADLSHRETTNSNLLAYFLDPEEFARSAAPFLRSDDREALANLIERAFTSSMVGVRVVDIDQESDFIDGSMCEKSDFYRVFLEVQDFVTRRIHPVWTQIDVSSVPEQLCL